jgi:hypothetical protein
MNLLGLSLFFASYLLFYFYYKLLVEREEKVMPLVTNNIPLENCFFFWSFVMLVV